MIKVTVVSEAAIQALPSREVEIPDTCPQCGADLTQPGAVQEQGYVWYYCDGHVDNQIGRFDGEGSSEERFDSQTPIVAYVCTGCDHDLTGVSS